MLAFVAKSVIAAFVAGTIFFAADARGQSTWSTGIGSWFTAGNWSDGVPAGSSTAYITNGGMAVIDQSGAACGKLLLGSYNYLAPPAAPSVQMTAGDLTAGTECIGYGTYIPATGFFAGTFTQSGGTNTVTNTAVLGYNTSDSGYNMSVSGTYSMSGGQFTVSNLILGESGGSGTFSLSGNAYLSATSENIGLSNNNQRFGNGIFTQSGGTNTATGTIDIGTNIVTSGTYSLSGSGVINASTLIVGDSGSGIFTQSGGTNIVASNLVLCNDSQGSYALSGSGVLSVGGTAYVGYGTGNGFFTQSGGSFSVPGEYVGYGSVNAIFTQTGGTHAVPGKLVLGERPIVRGMYQLSGTGVLTVGTEIIGDYSGSFSQSGGTNMVANNLFLANNDGAFSPSTGSYTLNGPGLLTVGGTEYVGYSYSGSGSFTQSGGTNSVSGALVLALNSSSGGSYALIGGLLSLSAGGVSQGAGSAAFSFGGGTLGASAPWSTMLDMTLTGSGGYATVDTTGGSIQLGGHLTGPAGLMKIGPGALVLSGTGDYLGGTTVAQGKLIVTNRGAIATGTNLIIGNAALFSPAPFVPAAQNESAAPVPEPSAIALLAGGLVAVMTARRRRTANPGFGS
jgi:hypothetical protein